MPKDILCGGFVDYDTNTYIHAILQNLNLNSTKPPPKMSLGISWNDQFQIIFWGGDLIIYGILVCIANETNQELHVWKLI